MNSTEFTPGVEIDVVLGDGSVLRSGIFIGAFKGQSYIFDDRGNQQHPIAGYKPDQVYLKGSVQRVPVVRPVGKKFADLIFGKREADYQEDFRWEVGSSIIPARNVTTPEDWKSPYKAGQYVGFRNYRDAYHGFIVVCFRGYAAIHHPSGGVECAPYENVFPADAVAGYSQMQRVAAIARQFEASGQDPAACLKQIKQIVKEK
jgi:hypothetical protein